MTRVWQASVAALALAVMAAGAPAAAQNFSEGFQFLKAVKERDGTEVTDALDKPGSTVINARDLSTGETALHIVAQRRDAVWIRFLAQRGANPNVRDRNGVTPLTIAVNLGHVEGAEALLNAGARPDERGSAGETPLMIAAHRRDTAMVRLLLSKGADPQQTDASGRSAREIAEAQGGAILAEFDTAARAGATNGAGYGPR